MRKKKETKQELHEYCEQASERVLEQANNSRLNNGQWFVFHVRLHDVYIASLLSATYYIMFSASTLNFSGEPCLI